MPLTAIQERELKGISPDVAAVASLLKTRYNAILTHDSGNIDSAPTWIFTLGQSVCLQVAVRMNKYQPSLYLLDKTLDGRSLEPLLDKLAQVKKRYTNPSEPRPNSLRSGKHAPYLIPSITHPLLLVWPKPGSLERILDLCLPQPSSSSVIPTPSAPLNSKLTGNGTKRSISPEKLLEQLDRNSATGRSGEELALNDELMRLRECGCPNPEKYVEHVAQTDVGRGYDIASTWPGEERYIEVKTTTAASTNNDFFLTENERQTLAGLGPKAWLYRVVLQNDFSSGSIQRVKDPIRRIQAEEMRAVVWRISVSVLTPRELI